MKIPKEIFDENDNYELVNKIVSSSYTDFEDESFEKLDKVSQVFSLLISMDGQIGNGGIVQFIDNGSGNYFHETIEATKSIRFIELTNLLNKATKYHPKNQITKDWEERRKIWDELCNKYENDLKFENHWEEIDNEYYEINSLFHEKLINYLKENAEIY